MVTNNGWRMIYKPKILNHPQLKFSYGFPENEQKSIVTLCFVLVKKLFVLILPQFSQIMVPLSEFDKRY